MHRKYTPKGILHQARRLRGAATAEFALAAVPLLLAGLAVAETGHWLMSRQIVRLALHEAARAGATQHGHPDAIRAAFEQALSPLYVPPGAYDTPQARMHASHERLRRTTGQQPWRIHVAGPPAAAYQDFGRSSSQHGGRPSIANDYLAEQHARAQERWPDGVGPRSGLDIHQANVLHLRLTYLKRPLTPIISAVLKTTALVAPAHAKPALEAGLLSITMDSKMSMQSDPVAWNLPGATIVSDHVMPRAPTSSSPPEHAPPQDKPLPPDSNDLPGAGNTFPGVPTDTTNKPPPTNAWLPPDDDSNLCGIVLCCN